MAAGAAAPEALARLVAADEGAAVRQVAMVAADGTVATHTGERCIAEAGHAVGDGFSCQANMMLNDTVWGAMAAAFEAAAGDLDARLLAALCAAEAEGGDIRGRQSAAILVVGPTDTGRPWPGADVVVDLRVEDHSEPLVELARLLELRRAYAHAEEFDRCIDSGDWARAWDEIAAAERLAPDNVELRFWKAVALAEQGREADAGAILAEVYRRDERWAELLRRLPKAGLGPTDLALVARLSDLSQLGEPIQH